MMYVQFWVIVIEILNIMESKGYNFTKFSLVSSQQLLIYPPNLNPEEQAEFVVAFLWICWVILNWPFILFQNMLVTFRVSELQMLLGFAGRNKTGRKTELQQRAIDLLRVRSHPIQQKIRDLYKTIQWVTLFIEKSLWFCYFDIRFQEAKTVLLIHFFL